MTKNLCPECGQPPADTTQNTETGTEVFECANRHVWGAQDTAPGERKDQP